MSKRKITQFQEEREDLNAIVMKYAGMGIKRFHNLDLQVYRAGALPRKTKELLGLIASFEPGCSPLGGATVSYSHSEKDFASRGSDPKGF